jgi:hypothetical protein
MPDCAPDPDSGFANVNMDAIAGQAVSVHFTTKEAHTDSDRADHPATDGTFGYEGDNGRYVLDKAQPAGKKSIKIEVTRPASLLEFGGEWVKMYEKDSWTNITNEYEPYTFNDFGSKVPLQEFRPTTTNAATGQMIENDAAATTMLSVFMEVSDNGDYEIRYGNPQLKTSDDKWIALEFKTHQLRVGDPFGDATAKDDLGSIVPVYLGNPALNIQDYKDVATTLKTALNAASHANKVATKVVLPIFTPDAVTMDGVTTWTEGKVAEADQLSAWHCDSSWKHGDPVQEPACTLKKYKGCYSSGRACPLDHSVCSIENCELQRWREIISGFHSDTNIEALGLIETKDRTTTQITADINLYKTHTTDIKGFYFANAHEIDDLIAVSAANCAGYFTVFATGEPLFDKAAVSKAGAPDVWVTLSADHDTLGVWTPYSWFSDQKSSRWGAIVDTVPATSITSTLAKLVDRGYGYVYLHDVANFTTESADLGAVIAGINAIKVSPQLRRLRGLQTQDDGVTTTQYECDDTLFECQPGCIQTKGVTRSKVSDASCSGVKPTDCNCRCYYDAFWTCESDAVVCKAIMSGGEEQTVGDLVCITRGTPKPAWDPKAETRTAGQCEPLDVEQTRRPTEQCLKEYAAQPEEQAVEEVEETTTALATTVAPVVDSLPELDLMGSAVHVAVGAALLALA